MVPLAALSVAPSTTAQVGVTLRPVTSASPTDYAGSGVERAWASVDVETRKRIICLLGVRITVERAGPGNGRYDLSW